LIRINSVDIADAAAAYSVVEGTEGEMTDDETNALRVTVISCKRWADDFTVIWRCLLCRPLFDLASGIARRQPLLEPNIRRKKQTTKFLGSLLIEASQGPALRRVMIYLLIMGRRAARHIRTPHGSSADLALK
jgi:hypothetical protein